MPRDSSEYVFTKIYGFPGFGSISRFGSKDLSNPKDDKTKDDAMVGVYSLEGPKPVIWFKKIGKSRNPTPNPTSEKEIPKHEFSKKSQNNNWTNS